MSAQSSFKYLLCPFEIIFLGDMLNNLRSVGVLKGHHGCQECSPNRVQVRHMEAPIGSSARGPILPLRKKGVCLRVICWILISACSPLSLVHTVPASAAVTLWGRGCYVVGTQRMPLNTERSSQCPFWWDSHPSRGQTPGLEPSPLPIGFCVCAAFSSCPSA